ncbi:MAG TPA: haloacid dehalogenase-like hydrolase [Edaphobacter sp.]|nr:haloacid dehalogenase-like hydrolase [Edaphobacter sp.]
MSKVVSVSRLNTQEFVDGVRALSPAVAVFDCDGTLWSGDAGSGFMNWTLETGLVSREAADWIDGRYRGYLRGEISEAAICGQMVQMYQRLREEEMRRAAKAFFDAQVERNIFPEMKALVEELLGRGVEIWAVSSTNNWVIEEGVRRFGISAERVLAARVEVRDGVVTDVVLDVPTDEGKVAALGRVGVTAPDAVFGNSVHDAAMLGIARRAFPVNPTAGLVERSAQEGWPVYYPVSVEPK